MKRLTLTMVFLFLGILSCSFPALKPRSKIISHPAPTFKMDNSFFAGLGCFNNPSCLPQPLQDIQYPVEFINQPSNYLGGLDPAIPIAIASKFHYSPDEPIPAIYVKKCLGSQYVRYIVYTGEEFKLIDSIEALAKTYSPIDSENEAFSYAVAATGLTPVYDIHSTPKLKLYAEPVEETYVSVVDDGFLVHLFDTFLCGCGPHIISSVDITVKPDGTIERSAPLQAYRDPKTDDLCVD